MSIAPITGRKVFVFTASAFAIIIGVNIVMAYQAVRTFPGLEVKNSYVASQKFDAQRAVQDALGWHIDARVEAGELQITVLDDAGAPVEVAALTGTLGRATHTRDDQTPDFALRGRSFVAPVDLAPGNWNFRMIATALDGTEFQQRVVLHIKG